MTIINIKKEFKLKLKIPFLYRVYFLIEQFFLGSGNLILLDGLDNTLCLFTESRWEKTIKQLRQKWVRDGLDEKWITHQLSGFYKSKIRTRIDFRGNILVPDHFRDFQDNSHLFFTPIREILMISTKPLGESGVVDPQTLTGNGLIITLYILEVLKEDAPDGPPTNKWGK